MNNSEVAEMDRKNENKYVAIQLLGISFLSSAAIWVKLCSVPPINQGFYRMLITLILLLPFTWTSLKNVTKKQFILAFLGGLSLGGDVLFWNLSLGSTSVANSALLINLTVFIVSPLSYFLFKEKIKKKFLLGAVIAFIGVVIVILTSAKSNGQSSIIGNMLAILASVSYSGYVLFIYKVRDSLNNNAVVLICTFGAMVFLFLTMLPSEGIVIPSGSKDILLILMYAICSQILGQGLVSMCLGKLNATLVTVISLIGIGISSFYAFLFVGETLTLIEIIGMIITIIGVFIAKQASQN
ncbi:DMT family transporter [Peptostreptococcus canis]|nr:DMT family transporter [Peptostreptococcus canis]